MTTKTGSKEGKHGVFFDDLPHFLKKTFGKIFCIIIKQLGGNFRNTQIGLCQKQLGSFHPKSGNILIDAKRQFLLKLRT